MSLQRVLRHALFSGVALCLALGTLHAAADIIWPVKWSQLPKMDAYGYDWSSETSIGSMVADDFLCSDPLPVTDLHWWGSYYDPGVLYPYTSSDNHPDPTIPAAGGDPEPPGILQGFNIEFYRDVPAGVDPLMPWSHPGTLLYEQCIPIGQVTETYYGTVTRVGGMIEENVWQYNVLLSVPFQQDPLRDPVDVTGDGEPDGTIYWLKIQAVHCDTEIQWGWHEAETLWWDNAVQHWPPDANSPDWDLLGDRDMAFELTVIPEPSVFLLAGLAGLGLLGRRRRR